MKKLCITISLASLLLSSGCATLWGGNKSECQRHVPAPGEPARKIRTVALVLDVAIPVGVAFASASPVGLAAIIFPGIDFLTKAIYKPCPGENGRGEKK